MRYVDILAGTGLWLACNEVVRAAPAYGIFNGLRIEATSPYHSPSDLMDDYIKRNNKRHYSSLRANIIRHIDGEEVWIDKETGEIIPQDW